MLYTVLSTVFNICSPYLVLNNYILLPSDISMREKLEKFNMKMQKKIIENNGIY